MISVLTTPLYKLIQEFYECLKNVQMIPAGAFPACHQTSKNAKYVHAYTTGKYISSKAASSR